MERKTAYQKQVQLLLQLLPFVAQHECFALKGGTAINLFIHNLPRLSVDVDLVFLPLLPREAALPAIKSALGELRTSIRQALPNTEVIESFQVKQDALRLIVNRYGVDIKIELSPVLRGTVFPSAVLSVSEDVENEFGYAAVQVVSHADLYAGKICAALDRQHPRDLFDVKWLLDNEGLTNDLRKALLVYLVSHRRPIAELLRPNFKDIRGLYRGEFRDMTKHPVSLADLQATRVELVEQINSALTQQERQFLLSFKNRNPDWSLLGLPGVSALPAIRWKQINLAKMSPSRHREAVRKLGDVLEIG